jgi:hypothetical protein
MIRSSRHAILLLAVAAMPLACSKDRPKSSGMGTTDSLTQRQRDSILAGSRIPGAAGVGAAMRAADATSGGIRGADSVGP